jgi:hypothetical protein
MADNIEDSLACACSNNKVLKRGWSKEVISMIEREPNMSIMRQMLSLFKATYCDAARVSWEPVKYASGIVLSKIEDGELSWADSLAIAEERRTSVTS